MLSRLLTNKVNKRTIVCFTNSNIGSVNTTINTKNYRFYSTNNNATPTPTPTTDINNYIMDPNKMNEPIKLNLEDFKHVLDPELVPITGLPSFIEVCLNQLHHMTSLPWLVIVPAFTLFIRTALFPLSIKHKTNSIRLLEIKPIRDKLNEEKKQNKLKNVSIHVKAATFDKLTVLYKEKKCHPLISWIPIVNFSFLVSSVVAFRDMASSYPSLKDAGALWFNDLTQSDPLFVLPVICSSLYLIATELAFAKNDAPLMIAIKWVSRGMALMLVVLSPTIPTICYLYWIPSAIFSIFQTLAFNSQRVSQYLGIPTTIKTQEGGIVNLFANRENDAYKKDLKYAPEIPKSNSSRSSSNNNKNKKK